MSFYWGPGLLACRERHPVPHYRLESMDTNTLLNFQAAIVSCLDNSCFGGNTPLNLNVTLRRIDRMLTYGMFHSYVPRALIIASPIVRHVERVVERPVVRHVERVAERPVQVEHRVQRNVRTYVNGRLAEGDSSSDRRIEDSGRSNQRAIEDRRRSRSRSRSQDRSRRRDSRDRDSRRDRSRDRFNKKDRSRSRDRSVDRSDRRERSRSRVRSRDRSDKRYRSRSRDRSRSRSKN
jgi:hypothetical protein